MKVARKTLALLCALCMLLSVIPLVGLSAADPEVPDPDVLRAQIDALHEADYTADSWAAMQQALQEMEDTLNNEGVPPDEYLKNGSFEETLDPWLTLDNNNSQPRVDWHAGETIDGNQVLNGMNYNGTSDYAVAQVVDNLVAGSEYTFSVNVRGSVTNTGDGVYLAILDGVCEAGGADLQAFLDSATVIAKKEIENRSGSEWQLYSTDTVVLNGPVTVAIRVESSNYSASAWFDVASLASGGLPPSTQEEKDASILALEKAIGELVVVDANMTAMEAAIAQAEALPEDEYTAASWQALDSAVQAAQALVGQSGIRQSTVDQAEAAILAAIRALKFNPAEVTGPVYNDFESARAPREISAALSSAAAEVTDAQAQEGTHSLRFEQTKTGWPSADSRSVTILPKDGTDFDASGYQSLVFWVKADREGTLRTLLLGSDGQTYEPEAWLAPETFTAGEWCEVRVSLSAFEGFDKETVKITGILIGTWSEGEYYIDNIHCIAEDTPITGSGDSEGVTYAPIEWPQAEGVYEPNAGNPFVPGYIGDPFMYYDEDTGMFYVIGTTDGYGNGLQGGPFAVWESPDFVHWSCYTFAYEDDMFPQDTTSLWAPAMTKGPDGRFYIYYIWRGVNCYVASAETPRGPWKSELDNQVLAEGMFDSDVVTLSDGKSYVLTMNGNKEEGTWGIYIGELNEDMVTLKDGLHLAYQGSDLFEGPGLFEREGPDGEMIYYLTYSNGSLGNGSYHVNVAYADNVFGPYTADESVNPILSADWDNNMLTTGHNNVIEVNGEYYICYHRTNQTSDATGAARQAAIEKLEFNEDGTLKKVQPTVNGAKPDVPLAYDDGQNLAMGATVTASSVSDQSNIGRGITCVPEFAVDQNNGTLWKAATMDEEWFQIDLGSVCIVDKVETYFEHRTVAYQYLLEYSEDGETWYTYADQTGNRERQCPNVDEQTVQARYLRYTFAHGVQTKEDQTIGIFEVRVYGTPSGDLRLSGLAVNGEPIEGFSPSTTAYEVIVDGSQAVITAVKSDPNVRVTIEQPKAVPGTATVTVLNRNTLEEKVYTVSVKAQDEALSGTAFGALPAWDNNSGRGASAAFDGNVETYVDYGYADGATVDLLLDADTRATVTSITFVPRKGAESRMVGGEFQGSNNGTDWTTLATVKGTPVFGENTLAVTDAGAYRFLRYAAPDGSYGNVAELTYHGTTSTVELSEAAQSSIDYANALDLSVYTEETGSALSAALDAAEASATEETVAALDAALKALAAKPVDFEGSGSTGPSKDALLFQDFETETEVTASDAGTTVGWVQDETNADSAGAIQMVTTVTGQPGETNTVTFGSKSGEAVDVSGYNVLAFYVLGVRGGDTIYVTLTDESGATASGWTTAAGYRQWSKVTLDISGMGIDKTKVKSITIGEWNPSTYYFDDLYFLENEGDPIPGLFTPVDKTELQQLVNESRSVNTALYTQESVAAFLTALDDAVDALNNAKANTAMVERTHAALSQAKEALEETGVQLGDVNGDNVVNSSDARLVLQYTVEYVTLTEEQKAVADVNADGKINSSDARWILQKTVSA